MNVFLKISGITVYSLFNSFQLEFDVLNKSWSTNILTIVLLGVMFIHMSHLHKATYNALLFSPCTI